MRKAKGKFKMKGHSLPGINQRSESNHLNDCRPGSSAFQQKGFLGKAANLLTGGLVGGVSNLLKGGFNSGASNAESDAGKELLKQEAMEEMQNESPAQMKLKHGRKKTLGGKLNAGISINKPI